MDTVDEYIEAAAPERRVHLIRLRSTIRDNLPPGFSEEINYGMIGWVVPLATYPDGYLKDPGVPLPFMALASQKQYISLYHLALYAMPGLNDWFMEGYKALGYKHRIDAGKSCIRFKYLDEIPYDLIAELAGRITVREWVSLYEKSVQERKSP